MNQEQNNLNQNNFNMQGNNGMTNNQSFNQQTINYQQSIMPEPISQPMNTFEGGNTNNQSFNSESPKKKNLGLIIGIITAIIVIIIGILLCIKLLSNNSNDNTNVNNNIKNGTAKLVYTSKNVIQPVDNINAYNYFETIDENGKKIIIDTKGNVLFNYSTYKFLGDSYFLVRTDDGYEDEINVYDANKKEYIFKFNSFLGFVCSDYKNGVLYYSDFDDNSNDITIAYDLVNKKELWRNEGLISETIFNDVYKKFGVINDYIFLSSQNYSSKPEYVNEIYPSIVLDLDGNVVIKGNTDKYEHYNYEKENLVHTFVMNDKYYLKVKFKKYIEVYDFNHKMISKISLETNGNTKYTLTDVFDGAFVVGEFSDSGFDKYILYDVNKNIILESETSISYASNVNGPLISSDVLALETAGKYYLIKDNKIVEEFDDYENEDFSVIFTPMAGDENSFLLIENKDIVNQIYTKEFINLKTLEKFDVPIEDSFSSFSEAPNGEYIIILGNVYDYNFNLKFHGSLPNPINGEYVFGYNTKENKVYISNIETGKSNEIEIKGQYAYDFSSGGFVTKDEINYYLYAFN